MLVRLGSPGGARGTLELVSESTGLKSPTGSLERVVLQKNRWQADSVTHISKLLRQGLH